MFRRMLCLLCAVMLLTAVSPASADESDGNYSFDFDLAFSLNAESFPRLQRSRAAGYAELVNRIGLRGNVAWSTKTQSMDLNAVIYYTDDESVSFPFRIFGARARLFFTSPLIRDQQILLNMSALMEFAVKAKNTLNVPLPYLAFLYPYATEHAFAGLKTAWLETVGAFTESGSVSVEQFADFSAQLEDQLWSNVHLQRWFRALADGSKSPEAVDAAVSSLPSYYHAVTGGSPVTVSVSPGSQVWKNADGQVLYAYRENGRDLSVNLNLPADENRYTHTFTLERQDDGRTLFLNLHAASLRDPGAEADNTLAYETRDSDGNSGSVEEEKAGSAEEEFYAEDEEASLSEYEEDFYAEDEDEYYAEDEEYYGEGEGISWPDVLLDCSVTCTGLPLEYPADSSVSVTAIMNGDVYPNYAFVLLAETKKDGNVSLSLCKPFSEGTDPVVIASCAGTVVPGEAKKIPDYLRYDYKSSYSVFSFNETRLAEFSSLVLPSLVRSIFSFVEAAPTSACQSFLDDLTDMGLLDMLLE